MKYIKKICLIVMVLLSIYIYASSSISRSLYSTKSDANVDYQTIGIQQQEMTIEQQFNTSSDILKQIIAKIRPFDQEHSVDINWILQNEKSDVLASGVEKLVKTRPLQDTLTIKLPNITVQKNVAYRLVFTGNIGGIFMKTTSGENNQSIIVNNVAENQALTTKLVYGSFHMETFIVLVGLLIYVLVFMKGMVTLFK